MTAAELRESRLRKPKITTPKESRGGHFGGSISLPSRIEDLGPSQAPRSGSRAEQGPKTSFGTFEYE